MAKAYPEEKVGVFAQRGEAVEVVEYSELDPQEAASVDTSTRTTPQSFFFLYDMSTQEAAFIDTSTLYTWLRSPTFSSSATLDLLIGTHNSAHNSPTLSV